MNALSPPTFPVLTRLVSHSLLPVERGTPEILNARARHLLDALTAAPRDPQRQLDIVIASLREAYRRGTDEPITWQLGQPHPLVPEAKIVRMFLNDDGAEIYSMSEDCKICMRNAIPINGIRFSEEAMPFQIFSEEIDAAESDEDDDDEGDPELGDAPELPEANGQAAP